TTGGARCPLRAWPRWNAPRWRSIGSSRSANSCACAAGERVLWTYAGPDRDRRGAAGPGRPAGLAGRRPAGEDRDHAQALRARGARGAATAALRDVPTARRRLLSARHARRARSGLHRTVRRLLSDGDGQRALRVLGLDGAEPADRLRVHEL